MTSTPIAWMRDAGASPRGLSGAMTKASCPVRRRCSSTRSTELETPLTLGRNDSATIATRTPALSHQRVSRRLRVGIRQASNCCRLTAASRSAVTFRCQLIHRRKQKPNRPDPVLQSFLGMRIRTATGRAVQ